LGNYEKLYVAVVVLLLCEWKQNVDVTSSSSLLSFLVFKF